MSYLVPVSVIVLKMSCTSNPAQCNNRTRLCVSQVIPLAATYNSKLDFHRSHRWPTLVAWAPTLNGWTPQSPLSTVVDIVSPQFTRQTMTCSFDLHFHSSPRCNIVFQQLYLPICYRIESQTTCSKHRHFLICLTTKTRITYRQSRNTLVGTTRILQMGSTEFAQWHDTVFYLKFSEHPSFGQVAHEFYSSE